jgi:RNase P/RNase MRP subunit POP5
MENPDANKQYKAKNTSNANASAVARRLKPSMRQKKRYVAYELKSPVPLARGADRALAEQANLLLGAFLAPEAGLASIKYNSDKQRGILRIDRRFMEHLRKCFVMIKNLNKQEVQIISLKTSGMINKVKKYIN